MTTQGFSTSHAQPFTLAEAILLDVNTLIQGMLCSPNTLPNGEASNLLSPINKSADDQRSLDYETLLPIFRKRKMNFDPSWRKNQRM
jgi:hypothetical protein